MSDQSLGDRPTTVLLVEDDAQVRKWIHGELETCGFNLLEAANGADALLIAELHSGTIDIVVTDVVMPRVNGPELVKSLLALRPDTKFLYISGYPESLSRIGSGAPGGYNYLQKPFDIDTLLSKIAEILNPIDGE